MFPYSTVMLLMMVTAGCIAAAGVLYSRGRNAAADDYFTARGSTGSGLLTATFLASFLGVFILFTPPEAGALGGISAVVGYALGIVALYLAFMVFGPRIRTLLPEGSTLNDFVYKRYGGKMHLLTVVLSIFYMLVHLVAELTAIGFLAYELAGIPLLHTALFVGFATMIYTAYGGLRASMFTDGIQIILVLLLLLAVSLGMVHYLGGFRAILEQTRANVPELLDLRNRGGIEFGLTLCIAVFVANLFHQGYWQRIYAAKNSGAVRKSLRWSILIAFPVMVLTGFFGIVAAGQGPLEVPSAALFSLVYAYFPPVFILAVFVLALVLVMSTADTLLNAMVAAFALDGQRIFKGIRKESLLTLGRVATVVVILPAALIAARGYSVLYLFLVADLLCAGVVFPIFYGLYQRRLTERIAIPAALLGIASGIPFFIGGQLLISFALPIGVSAAFCFAGLGISKQNEPIRPMQI